jgi:hypothetical protein
MNASRRCVLRTLPTSAELALITTGARASPARPADSVMMKVLLDYRHDAAPLAANKQRSLFR